MEGGGGGRRGREKKKGRDRDSFGKIASLSSLSLRVVPSDERLRRYERAVMMAVYSLHLSLQQLSPEYLQENRDIWEPLLKERRVWKLARHQNPFVSHPPHSAHCQMSSSSPCPPSLHSSFLSNWFLYHVGTVLLLPLLSLSLFSLSPSSLSLPLLSLSLFSLSPSSSFSLLPPS